MGRETDSEAGQRLVIDQFAQYRSNIRAGLLYALGQGPSPVQYADFFYAETIDPCDALHHIIRNWHPLPDRTNYNIIIRMAILNLQKNLWTLEEAVIVLAGPERKEPTP